MSSDVVLGLSGVSKCYQTYQKPIHRILQSLVGQRRKLYSEFWALQDVDLEVARGETVGILGKNGSGKSTMLQIIAGTLTSTAGTVNVHGRISALLELGAGFNPEFTGLENARLNAAIIGIPNSELEERLPDIIEFSELGDFVSQPVKTYSSGMYVRLAFSVAINMQPEILIIDEALAVGDVRFQRKCFRKLERLRNDGVSILFVTHSTGNVLAHCDRALFLDEGRVRAVGEPKEVVNLYLESLFQHKMVTAAGGESPTSARQMPEPAGLVENAVVDMCGHRLSYNPGEYRWGDRKAQIVDYILHGGSRDEPMAVYRRGDTLEVRMVVYFPQGVSHPVYGLTVKTVEGAVVYGTNTLIQKTKIRSCAEGDHAVIAFRLKLNLVGADYFGSLGVVGLKEGATDVVHDRRYDLFQFRVEDDGDSFGLAALEGSIRQEDI